MILRAVNLKDEFVYFQLTDIPVSINDKQTILVCRENSPILKSFTIARGLDDKSLFEFDFVVERETNKFIGFIVYVDGFYAWNTVGNKLIPLWELDNFDIYQNSKSYLLSDIMNVRSPIQFNSNGKTYNLKRIMYGDKNKINVTIKIKGNSIATDSVSLCTGIKRENTELAFGDKINDGIVTLHNYHPMLNVNGTFKELEV